MCSLQVLPPSGESTSKPVWNVTLKTWNLDDKQKIMNLKIRMTDELKVWTAPWWLPVVLLTT